MNSKGPSGQAVRKWGPREGFWAGKEDSGGLEAGQKPWVGKRWSIKRKRRDQRLQLGQSSSGPRGGRGDVQHQRGHGGQGRGMQTGEHNFSLCPDAKSCCVFAQAGPLLKFMPPCLHVCLYTACTHMHASTQLNPMTFGNCQLKSFISSGKLWAAPQPPF